MQRCMVLFLITAVVMSEDFSVSVVSQFCGIIAHDVYFFT